MQAPSADQPVKIASNATSLIRGMLDFCNEISLNNFSSRSQTTLDNTVYIHNRTLRYDALLAKEKYRKNRQAAIMYIFLSDDQNVHPEQLNEH